MDLEERKEFEEKLRYLRLLFDFHSNHWGKLSMTDGETENHIDDILDAIAEIEQKLKEDE